MAIAHPLTNHLCAVRFRFAHTHAHVPQSFQSELAEQRELLKAAQDELRAQQVAHEALRADVAVKEVGRLLCCLCCCCCWSRTSV